MSEVQIPVCPHCSCSHLPASYSDFFLGCNKFYPVTSWKMYPWQSLLWPCHAQYLLFPAITHSLFAAWLSLIHCQFQRLLMARLGQNGTPVLLWRIPPEFEHRNSIKVNGWSLLKKQNVKHTVDFKQQNKKDTSCHCRFIHSRQGNLSPELNPLRTPTDIKLCPSLSHILINPYIRA